VSIEAARAEALARQQKDLDEWKAGRVAAGLSIGPAAMREWLAERGGSIAKVIVAALPPPPKPKPARLEGQRQRLIKRWNDLKVTEDAISLDDPEREAKRNDLYRRLRCLVQLIGWIECHPDAGMSEFSAEMRRVEEQHAT
jgi:hypothetical protein